MTAHREPRRRLARPNAEAQSRRGALAAVYTAGGVSAFGTQMTMLALPWLVLETTGSATRTGVVFAVEVLPLALLGLLGAEVLQRWGARRTMVVADAVRAPVIALVPVLHAVDLLSFPVLLTVVAIHGVCGVPYFASQRILATELVGSDSGALTRANSVLEGVRNITSFVGPATAGVLISLMGAARVVWLDSATYAVSALLLLVLVPAGGAEPGKASRGPRGVWAGLRMLRDDRFLGRSVLTTVTYGFLFRILAIALPLLAFDRFTGDARLGGLLVAGSGAGALVGSLATYVVATRVATGRLLVVSAVLLALPLWVLVFPVSAVALVGAAAVTSAAVPLSNAPYFGILSARVPAEFLPRVLQTVITMSNIAGPLGYLFAGVMTDGLGITATLLTIAALASLASANLLLAMRYLENSGETKRSADPYEATAETVSPQ